MDGSLFFVIGVVLVVAAVILSAVGLRDKEFPRSSRTLGAVAAVFALLVVATTTYGVVNAREEAEHRETKEQEEAAEEGAPAEGAERAGPAQEPAEAPPGPATTLQISSPEDGSLSFSPPTLTAKAGAVTIAYDNPSPVEHNVAVELGTEIVGQSDFITGEAAEVTVELTKGKYTYFCAVGGHREGGMQGTLTVK